MKQSSILDPVERAWGRGCSIYVVNVTIGLSLFAFTDL